jgi:hypothetical protein
MANFIGGIADDVLRDLYKRGDYRDLKADCEAYLDGFSPKGMSRRPLKDERLHRFSA